MRAAVRLVLGASVILGVCLVALWAAITAGMWLAVATAEGKPTATRAGTALGLVLVAWILARAAALLAVDLRDPKIGRQL